MEDTELREKVAHLEEREKSNTHRIDKHDAKFKEQDTKIEELEKTYAIMEKMNYRMENVEKTVEKMDKKLDETDKEKGKKWDKLVDYVFYSVLAVILGLIYIKLGLK